MGLLKKPVYMDLTIFIHKFEITRNLVKYQIKHCEPYGCLVHCILATTIVLFRVKLGQISSMGTLI